MVDVAPRRTVSPVRPLQVAICCLVAATALVHLYLGVATSVMIATEPALVRHLGGAPVLTVSAALFYLNGVGYLTLLAALYAPALRRFRRAARWALGGYAALTIAAYLLLAPHGVDLLGYSDKLVEVTLICLLAIEGRRSRRIA